MASDGEGVVAVVEVGAAKCVEVDAISVGGMDSDEATVSEVEGPVESAVVIRSVSGLVDNSVGGSMIFSEGELGGTARGSRDWTRSL
jgi:hypothetical protein